MNYTLPASRFVQFLISALLVCSPGFGLAATKTRFRLIQNYLIVVPVVVNGSGPFDFLLDTGTTTTIVDSRLAAELRLQAADRLAVVTLAGVKPFPRSWLQSVSLGGASAQRVEVVWDELNELQGVDKRIRGILGLNFLDQFNYLIDYKDQRIETDSSDDSASRLIGLRTNVDRVEGKMLVTAQTGGAQPALRLGLDSGLGTPVIYTSPSCKLAALIASPDIDDGMASTLTGTISTRTGHIGKLNLGGQAISGLAVALIPKVDSESQIEDGVLPTVLFRSIYFNNRDHFVILNPARAAGSSAR